MARAFLAWGLVAVASLVPVFACSAGGEGSSFDGNGGTAGVPGAGGGAGIGGGSLLDSGGGGGLGDSNCGAATYGALRVPANVLLLLDRSGSMSECPDGKDSCSQNKWDGASSAIAAALSPAQFDDLSVGLVFFPAGQYPYYFQCQNCLTAAMQNQGVVSAQCLPVVEDCGCLDASSTPEVPVGKLKDNLPEIQAKLGSKDPDGNTPTLAALSAAYKMMKELQADGDKFVLLMTDGDPTTHQPQQKIGMLTMPESFQLCKEGQDIIHEAQTAAETAPVVKTFVMGSPGVKDFKFMSELAVAGGTAKQAGCEGSNDCYYQIGSTDFAAEFEAVLTEIAGKLSTCVFAIPPGSGEVNPNLVNVVYDAGQGSTDLFMDPSHQDGWDYTDESHTKVEIYGPACDAIKGETSSSVTILLGCATNVK